MNSATVAAAYHGTQTLLMPAEFFRRVLAAYEMAGLETSQTAIARSLRIGQSAVARWAAGGGFPTLRHCIQIATLTGVSIEWLLTGRGTAKTKDTDMDEQTRKLLQEWAELPAKVREEILAFVRFKRAAEPPAPATQRAQKH